MSSGSWLVAIVGLLAVSSVATCIELPWGQNGDSSFGMEGHLNTRFTIVDERGSLVDDVHVQARWNNLSQMPSFAESDDNTSEDTVDGTFELNLNDVSSISVSFTKREYLPEEWRYSFLTESVNDPSLENGIPPLSVTIVLKERPELADLEYKEELLHCDVGAPGELSMNRYLLFGEIAPPRRADSRAWAGAEVMSALRMECGVDVGGRLWEGEYVFDRRAYKEDYRGVVTSRFSLIGGREGDGLRVVRLEPEYYRQPSNERAAAEILEAPESGYSPTIEMTGEYRESFMFFVIRVHGVYGKGYVRAHPLIREDDPEGGAYAEVKVWINPTGSRNVATPRHR